MESVRYFKVQGVIMCLPKEKITCSKLEAAAFLQDLRSDLEKLRDGEIWRTFGFEGEGLESWLAAMPFLCFVFLDAANKFLWILFWDGLGLGGVQTWSVEDVCSSSRHESKPMVLRGFQAFWGSSKTPLLFGSPLEISRFDPTSMKSKFAALAQEHSDCGSAKKGGDLGPFKRGRWIGDSCFGLCIVPGQKFEVILRDTNLNQMNSHIDVHRTL